MDNKWEDNNSYDESSHSSFSSLPSEPTPPVAKKKFRNKTVKMPVVLIIMVLTAALAVSACIFLPPIFNSFMQSVSKGRQPEPITEPVADGTTEKNSVYTETTPGDQNALTIPEIAKKVGPSVVGVVNKVTYSNYRRYGMGDETSTVEAGSGSGFIISADGYVVTNNHVIDGASEIYVVTNTGEEHKATLVGADARTDIAVIKIEGTFPYAVLGNSANLEVGELAVAIGNPLGQEFAGTVTNGIISALNRSITVDSKQLTLLQTNAAINPGNSGGPLVNQYGEVIGINTVKISSEDLEGLGFAIPIDEAKPIIDDLIENGYVKGRPVIGIGGREITEQMAYAYDMEVGVYVVSMSPNSPASMSGIKIGDIIVEADGQPVTTVDELNEIKNKHSVGDKMTLKIYRGGDFRDITVILGEEIPE